jgi:hypothetical protein
MGEIRYVALGTGAKREREAKNEKQAESGARARDHRQVTQR